MATPLGARRGFVAFVTLLFAALAAAEAGATALDVARGSPAGRGLTVLAGLGAVAFAILTVVYARSWRRMGRPAPGERDPRDGDIPGGRDPREADVPGGRDGRAADSPGGRDGPGSRAADRPAPG